MKQLHFLFKSLNDLQSACFELEDCGIDHSRLHVVTKSHLSLEKRNLNDTGLFGDSDMIHTGLRGALFGVPMALLAAGIAWYFVGQSELGVVITGFITLVILGFCTWVGGLVGVAHENWRISPYHDQIEQGKSLLLVDIEPHQEQTVLALIASQHREAMYTGESSSLESPLEGGWNLHTKEYKEVA